MISDKAIIDKSSKLEFSTEVGPFSIIGREVKIGKNVKIHPNAVISGEPQDLKYKGEKTTTEIGDNTIIRECVTVNRGTTYAWKTAVGKNCLLMAYAHVAHDCIIGNNVILANNCNLAGHIIIEDFVNIGGVSAVQQFVHSSSRIIVKSRAVELPAR